MLTNDLSMIFEQHCIFNATKYWALNLIRTLMNICTKFKSTKKLKPTFTKVKPKKLFEKRLYKYFLLLNLKYMYFGYTLKNM